MRSALQVVILLHGIAQPADALSLPSRLSRRQFALVTGASCAVPILPVVADDLDDEQEDEIPDVRSTSGMKARKKPGDASKPTYSAADVKYAYADLVAARQGLSTIDRLLGAQDFAAVAPLLGKPPFSSAENNLLTLVQGPTLGPNEKKQIGTIKRYGVGADVLIMLGGLADAVDSLDGAKAKGFSEKAKNALDEVLVLCKESGLAK